MCTSTNCMCMCLYLVHVYLPLACACVSILCMANYFIVASCISYVVCVPNVCMSYILRLCIFDSTLKSTIIHSSFNIPSSSAISHNVMHVELCGCYYICIPFCGKSCSNVASCPCSTLTRGSATSHTLDRQSHCCRCTGACWLVS